MIRARVDVLVVRLAILMKAYRLAPLAKALIASIDMKEQNVR